MTLRRAGRRGELPVAARFLRVAPESLLDFSSDVSVFARDLTRSLIAEMSCPFDAYPDPEARALKEAVAAHEGVNPEQVLPGNGASELIRLAVQALAPRRVLMLGPLLAEYAALCSLFEIPYDVVSPSAEADFACTAGELELLRETDADLLIFNTPNNPSGTIYDNILILLHILRTPRVLADLSGREFLFGTDDYYANSFRVFNETVRPGVRVFTLHSFSAFFCCPGLRLGYLLGDSALLARIEELRSPWSVNSVAQAAGPLLLRHVDDYRATLPALNEACRSMGRELRRLDCMRPDRVVEGPGFLCCGLKPPFESGALHDFLLQRRILIRDCDGIPGMPSGFVRIQARPEAEAARLLEALDSLPAY
ncbi:MAG: aminotransferase class I/II-fold pyridoxal phosphate-dependent enzyme [Desulfovibrio sp.]|nr:aminotransferase class I/II-fold pyridoxal phosphate-dependent enzyme [Desulfovibrio sp.]